MRNDGPVGPASQHKLGAAMSFLHDSMPYGALGFGGSQGDPCQVLGAFKASGSSQANVATGDSWAWRTASNVGFSV